MTENNISEISIDKLVVDKTYQRGLSARLVKKIVSNFNPQYLGVLIVGDRGDGTFNIIDGQHRWEAAKIVGRDKILCEVISTNGVADESKHFGAVNTVRKKLTAVELFNSGVLAGDKTHVDINNFLNSRNVVVSKQSKNVGEFKSVAVMLKAWTVDKHSAMNAFDFCHSVSVISGQNDPVAADMLVGAFILAKNGVSICNFAKKCATLGGRTAFLSTHSGLSRVMTRDRSSAESLVKMINHRLQVNRINFDDFETKSLSDPVRFRFEQKRRTS